MKQIIAIIILGALHLNCTSQTQIKMKDNYYYTFKANGKTLALHITADSISFSERKGNSDLYKTVYAVEQAETKEGVNIFYAVKPSAPALKPSGFTTDETKRYTVFMIKEIPDSGKVLLVNENLHKLSSLEEAKKSIQAFKFDDKYAYTYYNKASFDSYINYSPVANADSATLASVFNDYKDQLTAEKIKLANTEASNMYGAVAAQDVMNNVLIKHKLNPQTTFKELNDRLTSFKIDMSAPPVRSGYMRTDKSKSNLPIKGKSSGIIK